MMSSRALVLSATAGLLALALRSPGATHYVSPSGAHLAPYDSWANAATNLDAAVQLATNGSLVLVTNATYTISAPILVTNAITVLGFSAETNAVVDGNHTTRCFYVRNSNAVIERLTIRNGHASAGPGVYLAEGTLRNCLVTANHGYAPAFMDWAYGGGVFLTTNGLVEGCTISSNVGHYGGGAYCQGAGTIRDCRIEGNSANNAVSRDGVFGAAGGGAYLANGGTIEHCLILANGGQFYGGGVYGSGPCRIAASILRNNLAGPSGDHNCFADYTRGGGAYLASGARIENCVLYANSAGHEGGGLYCGAVEIRNCTVVSNRLIYPYTTYNGLSAGISAPNASTALNCIVQFNADTNGIVGNYSTNWSSLSFSCTTPLPPAGGVGNISDNPQFLDLAATNLHLAQASPCIDSGTTGDAPAADLDGVSRPLDGDNSGAAAFDMGAYEFVHTNADTDTDGQRDIDEVIAGTDATNSGQHFTAHGEPPNGSGTGYVVSWQGRPGRRYSVMKKTSLFGAWEEIPGQTNLPSTGAAMSFTNLSPSAGAEFYCIRAKRSE